jgi:HK97 gp10 family phage protein
MAEGIEIVGVDEVIDAMKAAAARADVAARNIVTKGGALIASEAKKQFRARPLGSARKSKKSGRVYFQGAPKFPARPSRPTNRSEILNRSIDVQMVNSLGEGKWMSMTGPAGSVKYAPYVEYGTSRARKFPYMKPGLKQATPKIQEIYEVEFSKVFE